MRTSWGRRAGVWEVPTSNGWVCAALKVDEPSARRVLGRNGGEVCRPATQPEGLPITVQIGWQRLDGDFGVTVFGKVAAGTGIARVALRSSPEEVGLAYRDGYFVGELPRSGADGALAPTAKPLIVIGYGATGDEVARVNLSQLVADVTPA